MTIQFVLVSDDKDFFEYMVEKLAFRGSDKVIALSFDELAESSYLYHNSVIIVNSELANAKTLDVLNIFKQTPVIVSSFNDDNTFKEKCYKSGMLSWITPLDSDKEIQAKLIPALSMVSILNKNKNYRELLVSKEIISANNEVYIDCNHVLDIELKKLENKERKVVFVAISPNDKDKFLFQPNLIETVILNHIRCNDILLNYAPNKYFIMLFDIEINDAKKMWEKISLQFPQKIYAGFCTIFNQKREQLINEVLNKLHEEINSASNFDINRNSCVNGLSANYASSSYSNFKLFRQEFGKKVEKVISPVFYQIQQKYTRRLSGITLQQTSGDGYGIFSISGRNSTGNFRVTSPGFSKIIIDITLQKNDGIVDAKRISIDPEELEQGFLEDMLEQFINDFNNEVG